MKLITNIIWTAAVAALIALAACSARAEGIFDNVNSNLLAGVMGLAPFTSNRTAQVQFGIGRNTATKEWIEVATLTVPLSTNNAEGFNTGLVGYRIGRDYALGALNLSYSIKGTWPILGQVESSIGDGVARNYTKREYANYAFAGASKDWLLSKGGWWIFQQPHFGVGGGIANTSDRIGVDYIGGIHFSSRLGKK